MANMNKLILIKYQYADNIERVWTPKDADYDIAFSIYHDVRAGSIRIPEAIRAELMDDEIFAEV